MKASVEWLNAHLDRHIEQEQVELLLARQGFPIEASDGAGGVVDVEITSNRGDCLSHVGLARELAAGSGRRLSEVDASRTTDGEPDVSSATSVDNQALDRCPLYTARVIRDVKIGPSPSWMVERLEAIGLRSVNNVVDVTNYVLFELGQPLHAFDLELLAEQRVVVRPAAAGEKFSAIDGSVHALDASMLVIADAVRPVALAGVMGGLDSEVTDRTRHVLLESAIFDPLCVRRTSRKLKLASDSSYRFERGVDPVGVDLASRRAAKLICDLAGARLAAGVIRTGHADPEPNNVVMRLARCRGLLGIDAPTTDILAALDGVGLAPTHDEAAATVTCRIPSHRLDLPREVDLIEEVARMVGLEGIPVRPRISIVAQRVPARVSARQTLGRVLIGHGYHEAVTPSFLAETAGRPFLEADREAILVDDSQRSRTRADPMLRPSLIPSLLVCRKANQDAGNRQVHLFEVAACWSRSDRGVEETQRLALLADAASDGDAQQTLCRVRGTLDELAHHLGGPPLAWQAATHPVYATAASLHLDGQRLGIAGVLQPKLQARFDVQAELVIAELHLDPLLDLFPRETRVVPLPRHPAVERDLSIIVAEAVTWQQIETAVRAAEPAHLDRVEFLVIYRGKPVPADHKSVSLRMLYRAADVTLTHDQVDGEVAKVVGKLQDGVGAVLRD